MSLTSIYIKGVYYKDLGEYLGVIQVYPYKGKFYERKHKFAKPDPSDDGRSCAQINEILIERIPREDV